MVIGFAVVASLFLAGLYAVAARLVEIGPLLPTFVLQVLVSALFLCAYVRSRGATGPS